MMVNRRELLLFVFGVLLFCFLICSVGSITGEVVTGEVVTGEAITGEIITGEATSDGMGVSVNLTGPPGLIIDAPKNETYLSNVSIPLNFTSGGINFWYNIDGGDNESVTGNTFFNVSEGSHFLSLFANNSYGVTERNVSFSVNITKFVIIRGEYNGTNKGESSDFSIYTYEEIQNLSGIVLEDIDYGKISFLESINVTDDLNSGDNVVDLDSNVNISENRIELNSTALPNFNKSAVLRLYNLSFNDPRVLRDGEVCPSSICTEISYIGNVFVFNVTGFSVYSAGETPVEEEPVAPRAGGGGSGTGRDFSLDREEIHVKLRQGEVKTQKLVIRNTGSFRLKFSVSTDKENMIGIRESSFYIDAKEEREIKLDISISEDTIPNLYMGSVFVEANGVKKKVVVAIEVESKRPLLDVKVDFSETFFPISPGSKVPFTITVVNLGSEGVFDVDLGYSIRDMEGNVVASKSETFALSTQSSFARSLMVPEDADAGRYLLYVKAKYDGEVASSSIFFDVSGRVVSVGMLLIGGFIVLILIGVIVFLFVLREFRRMEKRVKLSTSAFRRKFVKKKR